MHLSPRLVLNSLAGVSVGSEPPAPTEKSTPRGGRATPERRAHQEPPTQRACEATCEADQPSAADSRDASADRPCGGDQVAGAPTQRSKTLILATVTRNLNIYPPRNHVELDGDQLNTKIWWSWKADPLTRSVQVSSSPTELTAAGEVSSSRTNSPRRVRGLGQGRGGGASTSKRFAKKPKANQLEAIWNTVVFGTRLEANSPPPPPPP